MPTSQVRFGLTKENFLRFEPPIRAAVLSFPAPVSIDWTLSGLKYSTYISRIRDAVKAAKSNPDWSTDQWLVNARALTNLNLLEIRLCTTNDHFVVLGSHEAVKDNPGPLLHDPTYFPAGPATPTSVSPPRSELMLISSIDAQAANLVVIWYCKLYTYTEGTKPGLVIQKNRLEKVDIERVLETVKSYDVGVLETEDAITLF